MLGAGQVFCDRRSRAYLVSSEDYTQLANMNWVRGLGIQ